MFMAPHLFFRLSYHSSLPLQIAGALVPEKGFAKKQTVHYLYRYGNHR